ncbi:MAG: TRAP transporter small permease [Brevundimonas sp.]|uniref:TRAP transporter small permease n=1 Tax=Brevundimonas sp. TaxID=1871086 RepID=UPI00273629C3|nr:TRAP transporter small permease [Brevundimonas sp.]MDP3404259.1 TRAP transporter small permease [Brevundimonas sp.]
MMLGILAFISRWISRATLAFAALGLIVMTGIIGWSVFARYILGDAPTWAEQAALLLMVWFVLLAAAVGVREQFHLGMTAATGAMPAGLQRICRASSLLVVAGFGLAMGIWGGELVARTWAFDIPTLGIPRGAAYLPLPIAGWLTVLFALEHLVTEARGQKVEPLWN